MSSIDSSPGLKLFFVPDEHLLKTCYERELVDAQCKAHAARVSYDRRRLSRRTTNTRTHRSKGSPELWRVGLTPPIRAFRKREDNVRPRFAVDSLCSSTVSLDCQMQQVLNYYINDWMPSPNNLPFRCQVMGMTPVRPTDAQIAFHVVQAAFQGPNMTLMYALLAASSRRLKAAHKDAGTQTDLQYIYNIRAVQGLRKFIDAGTPVSARTVLELSFLLLTEFLAPASSHYGVYRHMLRAAIIACGGLQIIPVLTAQIAMAFDGYTASGDLIGPVLNPFVYPELLGLHLGSEMREVSTEFVVTTTLWNMDERIRLFAMQAHDLALLLADIQKLSDQALSQMRRYLRNHIPKLYGILCEPLRRPAAGDYTQNSPLVIAADVLYFQIRTSTWRTWVRSSAHSYVSDKPTTNTPYSDPPCSMEDETQRWEEIRLIRQMLKKSGWEMPSEVVLWIAAVRYLSCDIPDVQARYVEVLRDASFELGITSLTQLHRTLDKHLALEPIRAASESYIWAAISHFG